MTLDSLGFLSGSVATKSISFIATGFLLFMGGCQEDPPSELMPLNVGNYWEYELIHYADGLIVENVSGSGRVEITQEITINFEGQSYRTTPWNWFQETAMTPTRYEYLLWQGDSGIQSLGGISSADTVLHKSLFIKFPVQKGESWEVPELIYNEYNQKLSINVDVPVTVTCIATDQTFKTPAGTFQCYVFQSRRTTVHDVNVLSRYLEYYSAGIGLVGQVIEDETVHDVHYEIHRVLLDYHVN